MPDPQEYKEVYFHEYCETCKRKDVKTPADKGWDICNECLSNPVNLQSHKPVKYEEKKKAK